MPIYEFKCDSGHRFTRYLKLADYDSPQICECGDAADRLISPVMFSIDATNFTPYESPGTGRWITSKTQRREDMKACGCVDYEPSLKEAQAKRIAAEDAAVDKKVDEHIEKTIYEMPAKDREKLANEVERLDINVTRV